MDSLGFLPSQRIIFCRGLDIRVAEIMEADVFRADGFQDLVVRMPEGIRVIHGAGFGRGEQIGTVRMLFVLLDQKVHSLLRDRQCPYCVLRLGTAYHKLPVDAVHLLCDGDGLVFNIQI